ncbi:MAG TPA: CopG family transcriptional regulator [Bryobacteraceae bacterium]|nr:CopG family transcriptional regulator [Bryobacteraceae bacterium]
MSIRTTVTLDEDVLERVKAESRTRGTSFKATINDLLRTALLKPAPAFVRDFPASATHMGVHPFLDYDDVEGLIEYGEGPLHR